MTRLGTPKMEVFMSSRKEVEAAVGLTRRAFLKYAGSGLAFSTVIGMVPNVISGPLGWKAYAQSEKQTSDELLALASKYGKPTGKFGKIGDPVH